MIAGALPAGFESLYLILDLPAAPIKLRDKVSLAKHLQQLLDLTIPLAARGMYLKLFLPDTLRPHLDDLPACEVVTLTWDTDGLTEMLDARIRAANGDRLAALCGPDALGGPSLDDQLIRVANGSPRRLVHLGNKLLRTHVQRAPDEPRLSAEDIDSVLGC